MTNPQRIITRLCSSHQLYGALSVFQLGPTSLLSRLTLMALISVVSTFEYIFAQDKDCGFCPPDIRK